MFSLTLFPLHSTSILCTAESTFGFLLILALKASVPSEIAQFCYTFLFSFNSILFLSGGDKNFAFLVFLLHLTRERNFIQNFYFDFQGCNIKLLFPKLTFNSVFVTFVSFSTYSWLMCVYVLVLM